MIIFILFLITLWRYCAKPRRWVVLWLLHTPLNRLCYENQTKRSFHTLSILTRQFNNWNIYSLADVSEPERPQGTFWFFFYFIANHFINTNDQKQRLPQCVLLSSTLYTDGDFLHDYTNDWTSAFFTSFSNSSPLPTLCHSNKLTMQQIDNGNDEKKATRNFSLNASLQENNTTNITTLSTNNWWPHYIFCLLQLSKMMWPAVDTLWTFEY